MPFIPSKAEDITKEWLQEILGSQVILEDVQVKPASSEGDNFASNVHRVNVQGTKGEEQFRKQMVIKHLSTVPWQREMATKGRMFLMEEEFFTKILPDMMTTQKQQIKLEPAVPRTIYAATASDAGVVIMEDLQPEGYEMAKDKIDLDEVHCHLVIEEMAKFHALGINLKLSLGTEFQNRYKELFCSYWSIMKDKAMSLISIGLDRADKIINYGQEAKNVLSVQATDLMNKALSGLEPEEPLATVCLGDCWTNNFLFKYCSSTGRPISVKLLDFQVMKYSPPLTDLAFFLCISTSPNLRKTKMPEFLALYRNSLIKYLDILGVSSVPPEVLAYQTLWDQYYKKHIYLGFLMAYWIQPGVVPKAKAQPQKSGQEEKEDMESGLAAAFQGDKVETLVKNSDIRDRFQGLLEELQREGTV